MAKPEFMSGDLLNPGATGGLPPETPSSTFALDGENVMSD